MKPNSNFLGEEFGRSSHFKIKLQIHYHWIYNATNITEMNRFLSLVFLASAINGYTQIPEYIPTDGLVAWYPFNGNANDESGNGNDGESQGAVLTSDRNGLPESAFSFDGSSLISGICESNMDMSIGQALSITYWIRPESYAIHQGTGLFTVGGGGVYHDYAFHLAYQGSDDAESRYPYFLAGQSLFEDNAFNISQQPVPLLEWSPVTLTVCNGEIRMYMNCELIFENTSEDLLQPLSQGAEFHIGSGAWNEPANDGLTGDLDDIGVWNRCLSPCEICGIHNSMLASAMVDAGPGVTVCQGDSVTLNATGALGAYTWSNGIVDGLAFAPDSSGYVYVESGGDECSITDSLFIDVAVPSEGVDVQFGCDSLTWIDGVTYTESTNGPTVILANEAGCDSLVTLDLTVNYTTYSTLDTTVINVLEYYGEEYTEDGEYTIYLENQAGCDSIVTVKLTVEYVGLEELEVGPAWTVFPNPAQDQLHIQSLTGDVDAHIRITNMWGQLIWEARITDQGLLDVINWPPGAYLIQILSAEKALQQQVKFFIE